MSSRASTGRLRAMLRRRAWIGLACMIAVALIAAAVSRAQSSSYSAKTVLLVPPSYGSTSPGDPSGARLLAQTYAQIIPGDDQVRMLLARRLGVAPSALGRITVALRKRYGILEVGYRAPTRARALAGARALTQILSSSLPAGSPIESDLLLLNSLPASATPVPGGFAASGELVVSPGAGSTSPANADGANKLAQTYAGVLADSTAIQRAVASRLHVTRKDVQTAVSVTNEENTSLLTVAYRASSPRVAADGANALAEAVTGARPVSSSVATGSLTVLKRAEPQSPKSSSSLAKALILGLIFGGVLGVILMLTREYGDRRVDDPSDLAPEARCPATMLDGLEDQDVAVLRSRWSALGPAGRPTRVALIPAGGHGGAAVEDAARRLVRAAGANGNANGNGGNGRSRRGDGVELVRASGEQPGWESLALSSDLTVVVAEAGARAQDVREQVEHLDQLGSSPTWALLTKPGKSYGPAQ